jgi:hypothetical protein
VCRSIGMILARLCVGMVVANAKSVPMQGSCQRIGGWVALGGSPLSYAEKVFLSSSTLINFFYRLSRNNKLIILC